MTTVTYHQDKSVQLNKLNPGAWFQHADTLYILLYSEMPGKDRCLRVASDRIEDLPGSTEVTPVEIAEVIVRGATRAW